MRCIFATLLLVLAAGLSFGQADSIAITQSASLAARLADSLFLSAAEKDAVYNVNMGLHATKSAAWRIYGADPQMLARMLQQTENSRDSLYRSVIAEEKYLQYLQRKAVLLRTKNE